MKKAQHGSFVTKKTKVVKEKPALKAQSGKVIKKTKISHDSSKNKNPMENYAKDFNLLTIKPLKPEKPIGDYEIKGSNSGTTGRLRKNGGAISYKKAQKAAGYKSGGKMGMCKGGC